MNLLSNPLLISTITSLIAIFYGVYLTRKVLAKPRGNEQMNGIADAISEGASAYMGRQYRVVAVVGLIILAIIYWLFGGLAAFGFGLGAVASAVAGITGMWVAVRSNIRTAQGAKSGLKEAFSIAFSGGAVTGFLVVGLALLSLNILLFVLGDTENLQPLITLGFGASLISVFARLGGGIYTKSADVGTDMVGKIEKNIPEDDVRNPGVIADLVGDNVGDDAGMAADLFETYVITAVATMILGQLIFPGNKAVLFYPLLLGSAAIVSSVIGSWFVKIRSTEIMGALYRGLGVSIVLALIGFYYITNQLFVGGLSSEISSFNLILASLIGLIITIGMVVITEFYTSKKFGPIKRLAEASNTGHGTNVIAGLALSMKSTFAPILLISVGMLWSYNLAGLYGVAISAMGMLSLTGIIVAIDAFGPITDNAGGIVEMSNLSEKVRSVTDPLDAVGNTTKAVTKAYAIGSAGLAALVLFASYTQELAKISGNVAQVFALSDPLVIIGLFIGGAIPYLFASMAMEAVGKASVAVVNEIRRQFKQIKGIMEGKAKPEYGKAVDIVTQAAIKEMMLPTLLTVAAPIVVGFTFGPKALGGLLIGSIITGLFVAISMTTGGAAWDNAKKYIEEGHYGGKGSLAHQSAVTGDTVGDPYKDTAGPAINPMIKVLNIVALLIAPFLL